MCIRVFFWRGGDQKKFYKWGPSTQRGTFFSSFLKKKITYSSQLPSAKAMFLSWCLNIWITLSSLHRCGALYIEDTCVTPPFKSPLSILQHTFPLVFFILLERLWEEMETYWGADRGSTFLTEREHFLIFPPRSRARGGSVEAGSGSCAGVLWHRCVLSLHLPASSQPAGLEFCFGRCLPFLSQITFSGAFSSM